MHIQDKKHPLYLDLDRFAALQAENSSLLVEIMQERLKIGAAELYHERKALGLSVTYRDDAYPGCIIREHANGKRFIISRDPNNNYQEHIVCEIPMRHLEV